MKKDHYPITCFICKTPIEIFQCGNSRDEEYGIGCECGSYFSIRLQELINDTIVIMKAKAWDKMQSENVKLVKGNE